MVLEAESSLVNRFLVGFTTDAAEFIRDDIYSGVIAIIIIWRYEGIL